MAAMMNFYLVRVLVFATAKELADKTPINVALVPLILNMSSVLFSSFIENLFSKIGRKGTFNLGFLFVLGSFVALAFIDEDSK